MNRITEIYSLLQEDLEDCQAALETVNDGLNEYNYSEEAMKEINELIYQIKVKIRANRKVYLKYIAELGGNEKDIALAGIITTIQN